MTTSTHLYGQLFDRLRQHSRARDLRHLKALAWMVSALLCSGQLSLSAWEPYVQKEGNQSTKHRATAPGSGIFHPGAKRSRWQRFMENEGIVGRVIYLPLVLVALSGWKQQRLYLALDTTVLWDRFCMIHSSGHVLWAGNSIVMAGVGTWQRHSATVANGFVPTVVAPCSVAVAPSS